MHEYLLCATTGPTALNTECRCPGIRQSVLFIDYDRWVFLHTILVLSRDMEEYTMPHQQSLRRSKLLVSALNVLADRP